MSLTSDASRNGNHSLPQTTYRRLSLKKNILWTGAGTAVYYVAQYALLSLIAKLTNANAVGQFALGLAVTTPIITFSQMQFRSVQVTDIKGEYSFTDYFWTRLYGTLLALLVITVMVLLGSYSPEARLVIFVFGLAKAFESLGDLSYGTLQSADRMDYVAISQIIKSVLTVLLFGGALYLTRQILPAILIMGGIWALVFFGFDLPFARKVCGNKSLYTFPNAQTIRQLVLLSLPLALTATMNVYLQNLPRYVLKPFGESQIGYFSAISSLLGMVLLVTNTVIQATLARVSRLYQEGDYRGFLRLALRTTYLYIGLSLALTLGVRIGGEALVTAFYTAEYRPYTHMLFLMCCGFTINGLGVLGSLLLTARRQFRLQMIHTFLLLGLSYPLYRVLTAQYGITGTGWAEALKYVLGGVLMNIVAFSSLMQLWRNLRQQAENTPSTTE